MRHPELSDHFVRELLHHPNTFGPPALEVALELGETVVLAVEHALDDEHGDQSATLADALEFHIPWPTVSLRQVALRVLRSVSDRALQNSGNPDAMVVVRLMNLATRLHEVGLSKEAVRASEAALKILQESDTVTVSPDHVLSLLSNLLVQLIDIGEIDRADDVVRYALALLDDLATRDDGTKLDAHRGRLMSSAALVKFRQGALDDALVCTEAAIDLFEQEIAQGTFSFRLELCRTLINHSLILAHRSQPEKALIQAEHAVKLARRLIEVEPDRALVELALSLEAVADRARTLGETSRAVAVSAEAMDLYETLFRRGNLSFAKRLAASLSNHAIYLSESGEAGDHRALAQRAVEVLEQERERHPKSVIEELPLAYVTYAGTLLESEQLEAAAELLEQAIQGLADCQSPGTGLRLAAVQINLAEVQKDLVKSDSSATWCRAAIRTLDELSEEESTAIPGLAELIRRKCRGFQIGVS